MSEPCDGCGQPVENALARDVRLQVDRSTVDGQRFCPTCFAEWITRYQEQMSPTTTRESSDADIIVD